MTVYVNHTHIHTFNIQVYAIYAHALKPPALYIHVRVHTQGFPRVDVFDERGVSLYVFFIEAGAYKWCQQE